MSESEHPSLSLRIRRRLQREAAEARTRLEPMVDEIRSRPEARRLRRGATAARFRSQIQLRGADRVLDDIVARALASPSPSEGRPRPHPTELTDPVAVLAAHLPPPRLAVPRPGRRQGDRTLRVAVVTPRPVPFVDGGNERHWDALVTALGTDGIDAELVAVDFPENDFAEVLDGYRRFLHLDLSDFDVVVSGKYPSYLVDHPCHVRHLNHPLRGLYDKYPAHLRPASPEELTTIARLLEQGPEALVDWAAAELSRIADPVAGTPQERAAWGWPGPMAQAVIQALDAWASRRLTFQAVVSETVARRDTYDGVLFPEDVPVSVIAPLTSLRHAERAPDDADIGAYFLAFGRLSPDKRFDLIIKAFARSGLGTGDNGYELWIAGDGEQRDELTALAAETPGVEMLGFCSDEDLGRYLGEAAAVVLAPSDEDYGLVAAEAQAAGRPVITTTDSGGVAEQIRGGGSTEPSGLVTAPRVGPLAAALRQIADRPDRADRMGRAGRDRIEDLDWAPLIDLVRASAEPVEQAGPEVLILSTFPAEPVVGGGSRRLRAVAHRLQTALASDAAGAQVTVLALTNTIEADRMERRRLDDGVIQVLVGRSAPHLLADHEMMAVAGLPVDDIGASVLHRATPRFGVELEHRLTDADLVILAHPFLATALPAQLGVPVVYDAHNVEIDLKASLLDGRTGSDRLLAWCEEAEAAALRHADIVAATSTDDSARLCPPGCGHRRVLAPNGVDEHLLTIGDDRTGGEAARRRILADLGLAGDPRPIVTFVGSDHPPNRQAADRLAAVGRDNPDLLIVLAGAVSSASRPGVVGLGRCSEASLRRLLGAADVIVNPVTTGSGTNLKLAEALASGTPVVSTRVGARGLDDPAAVLTLAEADPSGLAAAVRDVLDRPGPARARAEAGRELARRFTWEHALAELEAAIREELGLPFGP